MSTSKIHFFINFHEYYFAICKIHFYLNTLLFFYSKKEQVAQTINVRLALLIIGFLVSFIRNADN